MKHGLFPALALLLGVTFGACAEPVVFVDTRLMLLAHPLVQRFDPVARRFADTSSEPVSAGLAGLRNLESQRADLQRELDGLTPDYARRLNGAGPAERKRLEQELLRRQQEMRSRIETLGRRMVEAKGVPEQPGLTTGRSILPQVQEIADSLRQSLMQIQTRRKAVVILDIAPLLPGNLLRIDTQNLFSNRHFGFWRGGVSPTAENLEWIRNARSFLLREGISLPPIVAGAGDARLEAAQLMQKPGEKR